MDGEKESPCVGFLKKNDLTKIIEIEIKDEEKENIKKFLLDNQEFNNNSSNFNLITNFIKIKNNSLELFYYFAKQKTRPKALVFTFHGFCTFTESECSTIFNVLGENECDVVGFDQENHGRSCKTRNKYGKPTGHINNYQLIPLNLWSCFCRIISIDISITKFQYSCVILKLNKIIGGQSMGGGTVLGIISALKERKDSCLQNNIAGMFLSAPLIYGETYVPFGIVEGFSKIISGIAPWIFIKAEPRKCHHYDDLHAAYLKHKQTATKGFKIKSAVQLIKLGEYIRGNIDKIDIPFCLCHGTKDNTVKMKGSDELWEKTTKVKDKVYIRFVITTY